MAKFDAFQADKQTQASVFLGTLLTKQEALKKKSSFEIIAPAILQAVGSEIAPFAVSTANRFSASDMAPELIASSQAADLQPSSSAIENQGRHENDLLSTNKNSPKIAVAAINAWSSQRKKNKAILKDAFGFLGKPINWYKNSKNKPHLAQESSDASLGFLVSELSEPNLNHHASKQSQDSSKNGEDNYEDRKHCPPPIPPVPPPSPQYAYVIGSLFPTLNGKPNVVTSSSIKYDALSHTYFGDKQLGALDVSMNITTAPVHIQGMDEFLSEWYIPQMTLTDSSDPNYQSGLFYTYWQGILGQYTKKTRANIITDMELIGYTGLFRDKGASTDAYFSQLGNKTDELYKALSKVSNYNPSAVWAGYSSVTSENIVYSDFDLASLRADLAALQNPVANPNPPLWYPAILYTYQVVGQETSMPGPVLLIRPGEQLKIDFNNDIKIGDLNAEELQQSTLVPISTYGNTASNGLGGATTTNFHLHGMHVNPSGFGDNVVARYTSGQSWSSIVDLAANQAQGSYWYHSHYHPSVNGQLYGGLAGFMEVGDTLAKVPYFSKTPRNLVVLKNVQLNFLNGRVVLGGADGGAPTNQMTMTTVNGEFQPSVNTEGGWQSFSFCNTTNNMFYNVTFANNGQFLPLYIYGEDGHQLPQIRWSNKGILGNESAVPGTQNPNNTFSISYAQSENLIALAPGKRVDVLVYLPQGTTEIDSFYSFNQPSQPGNKSILYNVLNMGTYPDLSTTNTVANNNDPDNLGLLGPGALATLTVTNSVDSLTKADQDAVIAEANAGIIVQDVTPVSRPEDYNPWAVQSINFFAKDPQGKDVWRTVRDREFNWTRGTLVGPSSDYDAATQQELARIEALPEFEALDYHYKRYRPLPVQGLLNGIANSNFPTAPVSWLGYDNPFLINDHVFPNGNLTIAQIGTVEQWTMVNWSVSAISRKSGNQSNQYIGHPFHVHINDFQVENSDTELQNKRNLEDVVMINSSGYNYYNLSPKEISGKDIGIVSLAPLQGELRTVADALDPETVGELATYGANTQKVRMAFQDFLGTYVMHCHILPHEDAGMMQAIMVVDNTSASWLTPAEGVKVRTEKADQKIQHSFDIRLARDYSAYKIDLETSADVTLQRFQVGDLTRDYVQDILVTSSGDGAVRIVDGSSLLNKEKTKLLSEFTPYAGIKYAPWAFADDFNGDANRDIITGGFALPEPDPVTGIAPVRAAGTVNLHDFTIKGWQSRDAGSTWEESFSLAPWELIPHHEHAPMPGDHDSHTHPSFDPLKPLTPELTGFTVGDFNLDNFADYAMAYAIEDGLRITILDGEALALALQTGSFEGGYDPSKALLADALLLDKSLSLGHLKGLVLTNGFNGYAQIAIENLLITADTDQGPLLFTMALDAGHFIATSEPFAGDSGHQHGGSSSNPLDADHVVNLEATNYPLHLQSIDYLPEGIKAATPVFTGALANGALLADHRLLIAQGNGANGTDSTSPQLINTAQQLVIDLDGLKSVNRDDLVGILTTTIDSTLAPSQVDARNNLANLVYTAYCGGITAPGIGAFWAGASLGEGDTVGLMVDQFLADPLTGQLSDDHFKGDISTKSVAEIVEITTQTLYGRTASVIDIACADLAIQNGLSKVDLPVYILQNTAGQDIYRVGLLSAYSQWSNAQWGTDASVSGSYGQGFQGDLADFELLESAIGQLGVISGWEEAQRLFNTLQAGSVALIGGTQISPVGNF